MKSEKKIFSSLFAVAALTLGAGTLTSCVADDPFSAEGEADVCMRFVINSDVTRAEVDNDDLRANCVVYISSEKGLVHKYKGLENVPDVLRMKCGNYVAEAWTGDSVPASFDKKFFRGYLPFTVEQGINSPVLKCGIANVVASVNASTIDAALLPEYTITIGHKNASLDFTADNVADAKGYYMMPSGETQLTYTLKGKNAAGKEFTKTGVITGKGPGGSVERAHEYVLNFTYNPEYESLGGAFVTITIDDREILIEDEIEILGRPTISGVGYDLEKQMVGNAGAFKDVLVKVSGFGALKDLRIVDEKGNMGMPSDEFSMLDLTATAEKEIAELGFSFDSRFYEERNLTQGYLTLAAKFLNALPEASEEYRMKISAVDAYGKRTDAVLRIAVGEGAIVIDDPVTVDPVDQNADFLAIGSKSATLYVNVIDETVSGPGLEYKPADAGDDAWIFVGIDNVVKQSRQRGMTTRAGGSKYKITLGALQPGVRYAYRAAAGDFKSEPCFFTTEGCFIFPNASMEEWSKYVDNSKVVMPSADGKKTFWDSGNHGSATMSKTLTQGSTLMFSSGTMSAELHSMFVGLGSFGKFAAGNLFVGEYVRTDGTDGVLRFGRAYDGSHPKALSMMVNYRPGVAVKKKGADDRYIAEGATDQGQIYVALSTAPVDIETKEAKKLFNPLDPEIIAYGVRNLTENYGPDGQLQELVIPVEYYDKARTTKPLYVIVVITASRYGDYFSGGEGSKMYVDDVRFVY